MFSDKFWDKLETFALRFLLLIIVFLLVTAAISFFYHAFKNEKVCKIYSEEKERIGYRLVGKVPVATKYKTRDCLIWEGEK